MRARITTTLILLILQILIWQTIIAQCHIDDWTALKALYESTDGDNWYYNNGWQEIFEGNDSPPENCDLSNMYNMRSADFDENGRLEELILDSNDLEGVIPPEIKRLKYLTYLSLDYNKLEGSLPPEIGLLTNLTKIEVFGNQLTGNIPKELGELEKLESLTLWNNQFTGNLPLELSNLEMLTYLNLSDNNLSGDIPPEYGNLYSLETMILSNNLLTGSLPVEIGYLRNLTSLSITNNNLTGSINFLAGLNTLHIGNNYFTFDEIVELLNLQTTVPISKFTFSPQRFGDTKNIQLDQIETLDLSSLFDRSIFGLSRDQQFLWKRNGITIKDDRISPNYIVTNSNQYLGKYVLSILHSIQVGSPTFQLELISEPIYVTQPGKDSYGKPVELEEVIVEFDNNKSRIKYEEEILKTYNGFVKDSCACNRKIYLWEFHKDSVANVLIEIDAKKERIKRKPKVDGGPNNIFELGNTFNNNVAWSWSNKNSQNELYPDPVSVYLIDTGLDEINWNPDPYLKNPAPIESCYDISSSGYNFTDTLVNTKYKDNHGHGTYGFRSITDSLPQHLNLKVVPIKAFNSTGEGRLFDLICALYHSIDNQADIINISAGYSGQPSTILERALQYAQQKGVFITTAAGNDGIDIDSIPQYPAFYAGQYFYNEEDDSLKYDHIISVAAINAQKQLSPMSSYGKNSITLATYGENMMGFGLSCKSEVSTGTSISTYYVSKALALEIAKDRERDYKTVWEDFEQNYLVENKATENYTITGKILSGALIKHELFSKDVKPVTIYPNPASDYLYFDELNTDRNWKADIYNLNGALVLSRNLHCSVPSIKIKSLSNGTYAINLIRDNEIYQTLNFIKQ